MIDTMKNIFYIAKNAYRETIRDRILYGILGAGLLFIIFTVFLGSISLGEGAMVIKSVGLGGIYLFGLMIAVFLGASLLYKEIEKRTLYFILPKPVRHEEIIVGKFLGLLASMCVAIAIMTVVYLGVVWYVSGTFDALVLAAIALQLVEVALFIAIAIALSMLFPPTVSVVFTVLLLFIGHSIWLVVKYAPEFGAFARYAALAVYYVFPNLEKFNVRNLVIHEIRVPIAEIVSACIYGASYAALALSTAIAIFKRREF